MVRYLCEREKLAEAYRGVRQRFETKYWTPEYSRLYLDARELREQSPETVISVEELPDAASVITTGPPHRTPKRYRYQLRRAADSWQIDEIEWECFLCCGTGAREGVECELCGGAGWRRDSMKR